MRGLPALPAPMTLPRASRSARRTSWQATGLAVFTAAWLAGCGSTRVDPRDQTAEQVYASAKDDLESGSYDKAAKELVRVEALASGTLLAQQAQLELAYAQWRSGEKEQALATVDRFLKLNPSSPAYDYALYLRGVINFNDDLGLLGSISRQDLSERDQAAARESWESFRQLVQQFPQSRYAADASLRMAYIVNSLAEHEVHVARYYYRRGAYVAAANRAQRAVTEFERAPATEEALYILAQSYERLGLTDLSKDADRVMRANFPDSRYFSEGVRRADKAWWQFW
jgi:outer membrane protein assembly factor BamD